MDDGTDGWMDGKLHEKGPQCPLIYVILYKMSLDPKSQIERANDESEGQIERANKRYM
jgi:hypothetical protein